MEVIERIKRKEIFVAPEMALIGSYDNDVYKVAYKLNTVLAYFNGKWVADSDCPDFIAKGVSAVIGDVKGVFDSISLADNPRLRPVVDRAAAKGISIVGVAYICGRVVLNANVIDWATLLHEVGCDNKIIVDYARHYFFVSFNEVHMRKPSETSFVNPIYYEDNPLRAAAAKAIVEAYDLESLREGVITVLDGIKEEFRRLYD